MVKIGVLASGSGSNLQAIINAVEKRSIDAVIAVVISDNPNAYALERAKLHDIPAAVVSKDAFADRESFDAEIVKILKDAGVELIVLAGYMRLVSNVMIDAYPMRIMNIHPSLLPAFPGLHVQRKALEHGVKFSGCTVHFVDGGLDTGPIIIQAVVPVKEDDTVETLSKRILAHEHRIYPQAIQLYSEGRLTVALRRVVINGADHDAAGALENPRITIFSNHTQRPD